MQRIFNYTDIQVLYFFGQNVETFDVSHAFLSLAVPKLSIVKYNPVFLAHPVLYTIHKVKWRHRVCGHVTIAILWV